MSEVIQNNGQSGLVVHIGDKTQSNYGHIRVTDETTALFSDPFESLDTTNRWTTKTSTGTATVSAGNLTVASSTTASAYGGLFTQPTFSPQGLNFMLGGIMVIVSTVAIANSVRCWGFGTLPATPTLAIPVTDGVFFMLDGTGKLFGKVFAAGVEVGSVDLSAYNPTASLPAGYAIQYRADYSTFFVNSAVTPIGVIQVSSPAVETLPFFAIAIAHSTPPAVSATMVCRAVGIGDSGKNANAIRDSSFPWRAATVTAAGALIHRDYEKNTRTYSAAANVAAVASATDIVTITGSATATVFVTRVVVSGVQTTGGLVDVVLLTRSTANTAGTSTAPTAVAHDTTDAAATATLLAYTANPTPGTLVGNIRRRYVPIDAPASVVGSEAMVFDFGDKGRAVTLRGITQVLAVNLNGVTVTGGVFDVEIEWYEA